MSTGSDFDGRSRVLVIAPDPQVSGDLLGLLRAEAPLAQVDVLPRYPGRSELRGLAAHAGARLCFVDAGSEPGAAGELIAALSAEAPGLPAVALLPGNAPELILRCLRQGAAEFLIRPFTCEQLRAALAKAARPPAPLPEPGGGRLLAVLPGKGAAGATTLAMNLAFAFKRQQRGRILLADLDGLTGTVAFVLKLKPNYSFVDALAQTGPLDADVWKALATSAGGIDVVPSPESPLDGIGPAGDPAPLLDSARRNYDVVIADLSGAFGDWNTAIAKLAGDLMLVTTTELPALHATQRALAYLENSGCRTERIRVVVNRFRPNLGPAPDAIAAVLGLPVFQLLPGDYESIHRALLEGKPAPPSTKYGAAVAALAAKLAGERQPASRSVLGGLFARLRG